MEEQGFARYFDMRRFRERLLASDEETRRAILFTRIRSEAAALANSPLLRAPMLAIEERRSLGEALIEVVARHLSHPEFLPREHLVGLLAPLMTDEVVEMAAQDLLEITSKDPAVSSSLLQPFFFYKGFHAVAAQRLAHQLWLTGGFADRCNAMALQNRCAEVFGVVRAVNERTPPVYLSCTSFISLLLLYLAPSCSCSCSCSCSSSPLPKYDARFAPLPPNNKDIHPAATLGPGLFLDHASSIVIGETAVVGARCTLLHAVTLGGTGKVVRGDTTGLKNIQRHPKLGDGVVVGAGASVLGNIDVGDGAVIGAQAIVTQHVPAKATVVGINKVILAKDGEDAGAAAAAGARVSHIGFNQTTLGGTGKAAVRAWRVEEGGAGAEEEEERDEQAEHMEAQEKKRTIFTVEETIKDFAGGDI